MQSRDGAAADGERLVAISRVPDLHVYRAGADDADRHTAEIDSIPTIHVTDDIVSKQHRCARDRTKRHPVSNDAVPPDARAGMNKNIACVAATRVDRPHRLTID